MLTPTSNTPEKELGFLDNIKERFASAGEVLKDATTKQLNFAREINGMNTEISLSSAKEAQLSGNEKRNQRENTLLLARNKNRMQRAEMMTATNGMIKNEMLKKRALEVVKTGGFDTIDANNLLSLEQIERGVLSKVFAYKRGIDQDGLPIETPLNSRDIKEDDEIFIDFGKNGSANAKIGAADILPPSVRILKIVDMNMNVRVGTRQIIDGRAGYYDINGKYLPIYTGYSLHIPSQKELAQSEYKEFKMTHTIETNATTLAAFEDQDTKALAQFRSILEKNREEDKASDLYNKIAKEAGPNGSYRERLARMISLTENYEKQAVDEEKSTFGTLLARLQKTKEIVGDRNFDLDIDRYKSAIAQHESGAKSYFARNDSDGKARGVRPGAWAFGKYQFTIETLKGYGVDLGIPPEEEKIQDFLNNPSLQEEIMDRYIVQNLEKNILPNTKIIEDMARDGTSLSYYLALTHIGGPGALSGSNLRKDWLGTSTVAYAKGVASVYEQDTMSV